MAVREEERESGSAGEGALDPDARGAVGAVAGAGVKGSLVRSG